MGTAERRKAIFVTLCKRRHETIDNLASEFGVSRSTMRRDIEELSHSEPIFTAPGRYGGGVFVMMEYKADQLYLLSNELKDLYNIYELVRINDPELLKKAEFSSLLKIIVKYKKPAARR